MVLVLVLVGEQYCSRAVPSVPSGRTTHCSKTADEPADRKLVKRFVTGAEAASASFFLAF